MVKATRIYASLNKKDEDRLNEYMENLTVAPAKNKIVTKAIQQFLDREGF